MKRSTAKLFVDYELSDGCVEFEMNAPVLPTNVSWQKGMLFSYSSDIEEPSLTVDVILVNHDGTTVVCFETQKSSATSLEVVKDMKQFGWQICKEDDLLQ